MPGCGVSTSPSAFRPALRMGDVQPRDTGRGSRRQVSGVRTGSHPRDHAGHEHRDRSTTTWPGGRSRTVPCGCARGHGEPPRRGRLHLLLDQPRRRLRRRGADTHQGRRHRPHGEIRRHHAGRGQPGEPDLPCQFPEPGDVGPAGTVDGLPVGMQVIGRHYQEELLLDLVLVAERERPWPLVAPGAPVYLGRGPVHADKWTGRASSPRSTMFSL